jgi:nucleoside-diphosphate-sugar epimerase
MSKVLILGGTGFAGRILTENLLKSNYQITLFNRGKRNPGIFPDAKHLLGDRERDDIKQISTGSWDAVIDFSGMQPGNIELITNLLEGKIRRYIFISTANVYPMEDTTNLKIPIKEETDTLLCTEEQRNTKDIISAYGNKKAEMERILLSKDWLDTIIFRPGLIYGRYDPTDRFYYWFHRAKTQSEILIPENGKSRSTNTFSEDFAKIIEEAIGINKHQRIYNAVTHPPVSIKEILETASCLLKTSPKFIDAPLEFLRENNVTEWIDLPVWISGFDLIMDNTRLLEDFRTPLRTFKESLKLTIEYYDSIGWNEVKYGLKVERERELIEKLNSQKILNYSKL